MIYFRKLLDMFMLSMVPSIISFLLMSQFMGYMTWFITCIISTLIFFIGNALLIRRFVRDVKSKSYYYLVWLVTFAVYTAGGALCLINDWMYPFTWMFFHTRVFTIVTMPFILVNGAATGIPLWISFSISMALFLTMIFVCRPIFYKRYVKEVEKTEREEREARRRAREEHKRHEAEKALRTAAQEQSSESSHHSSHHHHSSDGSHHHHSSAYHRYYTDDDNAVYTIRQHRRMEKLGGMEPVRRNKQIGAQKAAGKKTTMNIASFFLNLGSYEFYQTLRDKIEQGNDPMPIIRTYIKRRLNLGLRAGKRR